MILRRGLSGPVLERIPSMSAIRSIRLFTVAALLGAPCTFANGLMGDAAAGKTLFLSSSCPTCHALTKDDNSSEEIDVENLGEIYVRFFWDRKKKPVLPKP